MKMKQKTATADKSSRSIYNHSITSVLRALGKAGVTNAMAREIMQSMRVDISPITISIQVGAGKRADVSRGTPAPLSKTELKTLLGKAPLPAAKPAQSSTSKSSTSK